jgi:hypothetical protein
VESKADGPASGAAASAPVGLLVGGFGDGVGYAAAAQQAAVGPVQNSSTEK